MNLMLQKLCIHVIKDCILKQFKELSGWFSFFVTFVLVLLRFGPLGLFHFFSSGCTAGFHRKKNRREKRVKWWKMKENVQMRKDKYQ